MGVQSICKVKALVTPVKPDGTNEAALAVPYYFRGSNVYKASPEIQQASLIEHIPAIHWQGDMPLTPVADLIRAGILARVAITVQDTNRRKRNYDLIVDAEQLPIIFDGTNAGNIDGKPFILTKRDGTTVNKGNIIKIGSRTEAYNP